MREIISILQRWADEGTPIAVGNVIERVGSAPRDPGATLAVSGTGEIAGSVTGGCVEPGVIYEAKQVLDGGPGKIVRYGLDDEDGFDVGLSCGGSIAVAVYLLDTSLLPQIVAAVESDTPLALAVRMDEGRLGEQRLVTAEGNGDDPVDAAARLLLEIGESGIVETSDGELVYVESYAPRPDMYIFGASDHVAALATMGKFLGYRVTVCDAREAFVTRERFPDADELVVEWPHTFLEGAPVTGSTAICVLTHDYRKYDVPALVAALDTNAGYIGAIGSEKTRRERDEALRQAGVGDADMARIHAPIGIQIGARTPDEVAVTIAAQLIESTVAARATRVASVVRATVLS